MEGLLEGGDDKEGKKLIADVAPYLRKAVPSVSALLAELSEGRFSLFSMEGFIILLPKGQKGGGDEEGPRILLEWKEKEEAWSGRIKSRLEWRGVKVGQFGFRIEVQPIR